MAQIYMIGCWQAKELPNGTQDTGLREDIVLAECREHALDQWNDMIAENFNARVTPVYVIAQRDMEALQPWNAGTLDGDSHD